MANWCSNTVVFEGEPKAIEQIQQLFQTMKGREEKEEQGQLPDFVPNTNGGYFFNIYWNDGDKHLRNYYFTFGKKSTSKKHLFLFTGNMGSRDCN